MGTNNCLMQVLNGEKPSEHPAILLGDGGRALEGVTQGEIRADAQKLANTSMNYQKKVGMDWCIVFSDPFITSEAIGCTVDIKDGGRPEITKVLDLATFTKPDVDFQKTASCKTNLEAMDICKNAGLDVPLGTIFEAAVTVATRVFGAENCLMAMIEEPEDVNNALDIIVDILGDYADECVKRGVEAIMIPDPMSSSNVMSVRQYKKFAMQYQIQLIERIHKAGAKVILHICGDTMDRLELMASTGADALSLDQIINFVEARELIGPDMVLMGNVEPIISLLEGTPEDVTKNAYLCLERGGADKHILAPGCAEPPLTPIENMKAMIRAAKEYKF